MAKETNPIKRGFNEEPVVTDPSRRAAAAGRTWVFNEEEPPLPPQGAGRENRQSCAVWLLTGVLIVATLVGAALLFLNLTTSEGGAPAAVPEQPGTTPLPQSTAADVAAATTTSQPALEETTAATEAPAVIPSVVPTDVPTVPPTATATGTATATPTAIPTATPTPTITPTPTPTPDVILIGVKALGELNTVQYTLDTVVEKDVRQPALIDFSTIEIWRPQLHFLLVAGGRVKAGVDFAEMLQYDVVGSRVTVYLPSPRITEYSIDPNSIKVHYLYAGYGLDEAFVIETYNEALVEAQESLRDKALQSDILQAARDNATAILQSLILGLGFSEVEVQFLPPGAEELGPLDSQPLESIPTLPPFTTATPEG